MRGSWDPRGWGVVQVLTSVLVLTALSVTGMMIAPQVANEVLFLLLLVGIAVTARSLATFLRARYGPTRR